MGQCIFRSLPQMEDVYEPENGPEMADALNGPESEPECEPDRRSILFVDIPTADITEPVELDPRFLFTDQEFRDLILTMYEGEIYIDEDERDIPVDECTIDQLIILAGAQRL